MNAVTLLLNNRAKPVTVAGVKTEVTLPLTFMTMAVLAGATIGAGASTMVGAGATTGAGVSTTAGAGATTGVGALAMAGAGEALTTLGTAHHFMADTVVFTDHFIIVVTTDTVMHMLIAEEATEMQLPRDLTIEEDLMLQAETLMVEIRLDVHLPEQIEAPYVMDLEQDHLEMLEALNEEATHVLLDQV